MLTPHPTSPGVVLIRPDADLAIDRRCPVLIPISKNLKGRVRSEPVRGVDCPCRCFHPRLGETINTYALAFESDWRFSSNDPCDQVKDANLLEGCYMKIKGGLKLRDWKCPEHVHPGPGPHHHEHAHELVIGCQTGEFVIFRPVDPADPTRGFVAVFTGDLTGVVGLDPAPCNEHPRCCQENHTQGMLNGRGVGPMEGCTICAAYQGAFDSLDGRDLCREQGFRWNVTLDGTICCPCPEKAEAEPGKKAG